MKYKNSRQREAVAEVLNRKNYHPTAEEIYTIVKKNFPKISLATVYRNVERLCQMEKIWKIETDSQPSRYDGNTKRHFHITCRNCGKVKDVWLDQRLEDHIDVEKAIEGFKLAEYKIDFYGICEECLFSKTNNMSKSNN